jgi:1-deoxy-D-xylulose-5-phosphate reductoisomerase
LTGVAVLGSTGTIGVNTLDVIARHPERFEVVALGARRNVARLAEQCARFRPRYAAIADDGAAGELAEALRAASPGTKLLAGESAMEAIATLPEAPFVMAGIVGAAGLRSTLAAARSGQRLMIANKESLVMAGALLLEAARRSGATLLPIDSEHNAIFQCMPHGSEPGVEPPGVRRILLTASGGPFLDWSAAQIAAATPQQACAHPRWVMGRKISVDSATLMNKGLEIIEAHLLFGVPVERIDVVVHRQSIVHSLVEYADGSVLAQLGAPDMRTPIAQALAWPLRIDAGVERLDLLSVGRLDFQPPDPARFPCLALARDVASRGGLAPAILNAANEVVVAAFLQGRVNFPAIATVIERVLTEMTSGSSTLLRRNRDGAVESASLEEILAVDGEARGRAEIAVAGSAGLPSRAAGALLEHR